MVVVVVVVVVVAVVKKIELGLLGKGSDVRAGGRHEAVTPEHYKTHTGKSVH